MKKGILVGLVLGMTLTLTGCFATSLQPTHVALARWDMVQVRSDSPVALINAQEAGASMVKVGETDTETDLSLWSAQAIANIGTWLKAYDIHLSPDAVKKLKVSIVEPSISLAKHLPCAHLSLKVETEGDITKVYPVEGCASNNNRAIGYAISYGVIEMIRDRDITDYIDQRYKQEVSQQASD